MNVCETEVETKGRTKITTKERREDKEKTTEEEFPSKGQC